jgi:ATP synthase protein I
VSSPDPRLKIPEALTRPVERPASMRKEDTARRDAAEAASPWKTFGAVAGLGFELVAAVIVVGLMGFGVDYLLGSGPWGLVVGAALGLGLGFWRMVKVGLSRVGGGSGGRDGADRGGR